VAARGVNLMLALNEVGGMVQKAARGAGIPLGQAEDLGRIAIYLASTSKVVTAITNALQEDPSNVDVVWGKDAITVKSGPAALLGPIIRDAFAMGCSTATLADLDHAPLIAAYLADGGIALTWDGKTLERSDTTVIKPTCNPVAIPDVDWSIWAALAANTYVPQSEESRLAGAGAGLNDND
jgi:hypothetical protein